MPWDRHRGGDVPCQVQIRMGGYPARGYLDRVSPWQGTPLPARSGWGGGYPVRTTEGVVTTWRAVCLLRSRRRTFLLDIALTFCFSNCAFREQRRDKFSLCMVRARLRIIRQKFSVDGIPVHSNAVIHKYNENSLNWMNSGFLAKSMVHKLRSAERSCRLPMTWWLSSKTFGLQLLKYLEQPPITFEI